MSPARRRLMVFLLAGAGLALAGGWAWQHFKPAALPSSIVSGNGRIEGTEIDIAAKSAGRLLDVLVNEGDFVEAGQIVAHMDTAAQQAELRQMQAKVMEAKSAIAAADAQTAQRRQAEATARSLIAQRKRAKTTVQAQLAQRQSEVEFARNELKRSEELVAKGFITEQRLDSDRTRLQSANAALDAAQSQMAEADAAIDAASSQAAEANAAISASISQVEQAKAALVAAQAAADKLATDIEDGVLKATRGGRVQYRLAEPGEVLGAGGKVLTILDVSDVYMTFFLPETVAGKVAIGAESRLVLDAIPQYVIPAQVSFVASSAQFTPKTVETRTEREKLVFRVKARIEPQLLQKYRTRVKTGLPGVAYVRLDDATPWPAQLQVKLPPP